MDHYSFGAAAVPFIQGLGVVGDVLLLELILLSCSQ